MQMCKILQFLKHQLEACSKAEETQLEPMLFVSTAEIKMFTAGFKKKGFDHYRLFSIGKNCGGFWIERKVRCFFFSFFVFAWLH